MNPLQTLRESRDLTLVNPSFLQDAESGMLVLVCFSNSKGAKPFPPHSMSTSKAVFQAGLVM